MNKDILKIQKSDYTELMRTPLGRRVIADILESTGVDGDTWDDNPLIQSQLNGKRQVGLRIIRKLKDSCPDLYLTLIKEQVLK